MQQEFVDDSSSAMMWQSCNQLDGVTSLKPILKRQQSTPVQGRQQNPATAHECVGENQVRRSGMHKKSMSTGQMLQNNPEIAQLLNQFLLNHSLTDSDVKYAYPGSDSGGGRFHRMEGLQEGDEDAEFSDTCSQLSSSDMSTACSSPAQDDDLEMAEDEQFGKIRNVVNNLSIPLNPRSSANTFGDDTDSSPMTPVINSSKPSFDVTQLRLNLNKLEPQTSISSVDAAVDQLLAMSVGYALWTSATPTPRKSPSPSPEQFTNRSDRKWIQPLPGDANKDTLILEANSQIANLKHHQIKATVEKELLEEEMQYWRSKVQNLEQKLVQAEESAADKDDLITQLNTKLQICQINPQMYIQSHACTQTSDITLQNQRQQLQSQPESQQRQLSHTEDNNVSSISDISVSYQSGTSSLLKAGRNSEDDVKKYYPPIENFELDNLLQNKTSLFSAENEKTPIFSEVQEEKSDQKQKQQLSQVVLGMLWSSDGKGVSFANVAGLVNCLGEICKEILLSEKYRNFWDWFSMIVFPVMGCVGTPLMVTLGLAAISFFWRKIAHKNCAKWLNQLSA